MAQHGHGAVARPLPAPACAWRRHRPARGRSRCRQRRGESVSIRDVLRLDVAGGFIELPVEIGVVSTLPLLVERAQRCILAELAEHVQAAGDQFLERHAVMAGDVVEADVYFFLVVFGAEINGRPDCRQGAKPVLAGDMGDVLHHLDDALAGATFAGEQTRLVKWHAIQNGPFAFGPWFIVPVGHVEELQRRKNFAFGITVDPGVPPRCRPRPVFPQSQSRRRRS